MSPSKIFKKKKIDQKGLSSLVSKNLKLKKIKVSPKKVIEETKNKIDNF